MWLNHHPGTDTASYNGADHYAMRDYYAKAATQSKAGAKLHFFSSKRGGHECDVYHLDRIMAVFDKHCKGVAPPLPAVTRRANTTKVRSNMEQAGPKQTHRKRKTKSSSQKKKESQN